jgi:ketosteroid isomerase-like protein
MTESERQELIDLNQKLLRSIRDRDWDAYQLLCDPTLTCFEPEARGHLVAGLEFHRSYFDQGGHLGPHANTICAPHVRMLGADVAVVAYTRLVQQFNADGTSQTATFEETRVWQKSDGNWRHVHFHRSTGG